MSIATVVTMGYGSFGTVNFLPTIGYSIGVTTAPTVVYDSWVAPQRMDGVAPRLKDWVGPQRMDWVAPQQGDE